MLRATKIFTGQAQIEIRNYCIDMKTGKKVAEWEVKKNGVVIKKGSAKYGPFTDWVDVNENDYITLFVKTLAKIIKFTNNSFNLIQSKYNYNGTIGSMYYLK
jgi:hypothetical protein